MPVRGQNNEFGLRTFAQFTPLYPLLIEPAPQERIEALIMVSDMGAALPYIGAAFVLVRELTKMFRGHQDTMVQCRKVGDCATADV